MRGRRAARRGTLTDCHAAILRAASTPREGLHVDNPVSAVIMSSCALVLSVFATGLAYAAYRRSPTPLPEMPPLVQVKPRLVRSNPELPPFDPPMIDGMTPRDWLIWSWRARIPDDVPPEQGVWLNVTNDFYEFAVSKPAVLAVFKPYLGDIDRIKRKFLSTLLIVLHIGLDERAADAVVAKHAYLRISGDAYDDTIDALVQVLLRYGMPREAVEQLNPMLNYLGTRLVTVAA